MNRVVSWILRRVAQGADYFGATIQAITQFNWLPRDNLLLYGFRAGSAAAVGQAMIDTPGETLSALTSPAEPLPSDLSRRWGKTKLLKAFKAAWGDDGEVEVIIRWRSNGETTYRTFYEQVGPGDTFDDLRDRVFGQLAACRLAVDPGSARVVRATVFGIL